MKPKTMKTIKSVLQAFLLPNIQEVYKAIDNYLEKAEALKYDAPFYGVAPDITVIDND